MTRIVLMLAMAASFAACNNITETKVQSKAEVVKQVKDSLRLDSFNKAAAVQVQLAESRAVRTSQASVSGSTPRRTYVKGVSETYTSTAPQKKGWSKAAKGAAIGAGTGAVAGVLIDKKDGRGAIVGGLAGAGAGYVIGRSQDRKDGRVQ